MGQVIPKEERALEPVGLAGGAAPLGEPVTGAPPLAGLPDPVRITPPPRFELVDGQLVYRAALANLKSLLDQHEVEVTSGPLPQVLGNGFQLIELFEQLLTRALKLRGRHRLRIRISTRANGDRWLVAVSTNGRGLEGAELDQLRAVQVKPDDIAATSAPRGGFAWCEAIVERHGGQLWVDSAPGQGLTVYFTLPKVKPESLPTEQFRIGP